MPQLLCSGGHMYVTLPKTTWTSFPAGETSTLVGGEYTYNIYTHIVIPNIYIENVYKIVVT